MAGIPIEYDAGAAATRFRRIISVSPSKSRTDALMAGEELSSAAQRERRKRIVDATIALASKGGYDAVQMRAVADRADVALGTHYRYFPSKIHLLVSAMARELDGVRERT